MNSPLESPDVIHTFLPLSDIGAATTSMASIKLSSMDSLPLKSHHTHQVRPIRITSSTTTVLTSSTPVTSYLMGSTKLSSLINSFSNNNNNYASAVTATSNTIPISITNNNNNNNTSKSLSAIPETILELPELMTTATGGGSEEKLLSKLYTDDETTTDTSTSSLNYNQIKPPSYESIIATRKLSRDCLNSSKPLLEFSLSSVGRSFIDNNDDTDQIWQNPDSLTTPLTPPPNVSPSTSSNRFSETFSSDFNKPPSTPSIIVSPIADEQPPINFFESNFDGSWDLLELDLDFHEVNLDPSFGGDVQECIFLGDDPFGVLPCRPTPPDSLDL